MGILWLYELQQSDSELKESLAKVSKRVLDLETRCAELEESNSNLKIFVQSLIDLSWDKLDITNEQLQARIEVLKDERNRAEADEAARKMMANRKAFACPNCGQPVAMTSKVCFYCGQPASPPEAQKEPK